MAANFATLAEALAANIHIEQLIRNMTGYAGHMQSAAFSILRKIFHDG